MREARRGGGGVPGRVRAGAGAVRVARGAGAAAARAGEREPAEDGAGDRQHPPGAARRRRGRRRAGGRRLGGPPSCVWQKNILMGGKCQLPEFSGVINYDAAGNIVAPSGRPRAAGTAALGW